MESMRVHGLASQTARSNFERFLDAVNSCEELDIVRDTSLESTRLMADEFKTGVSLMQSSGNTVVLSTDWQSKYAVLRGL